MGIETRDWQRTIAGLKEGDASYCHRRAVEERALALDAIHPRVRQAHLDMAQRYDDLARAIVAFERHLEHKLDEVA